MQSLINNYFKGKILVKGVLDRKSFETDALTVFLLLKLSVRPAHRFEFDMPGKQYSLFIANNCEKTYQKQNKK